METLLKRSSSFRGSSSRKPFFTRMLLEWFQANGRKFPWRSENDQFRVLIAEIMLQRTKAEQVVPVYEEFISVFPNIDSLNSADTEEIKRFIKRLGLLWRAGLVMKMIKMISTDYHGSVPNDSQQLRNIPGVGDYIADAVIVFGFGGKRIIIDSNVVRIISRFFGFKAEGELRRNKDFSRFCQSLIKHVPSKRIKDFNWALLDHPAIVCRPKPFCEICPLSEKCDYFANRFNN